VVLPGEPQFQPLAVALAMCENWTARHGGACRVHGGGFAGTVLAIIPAHKGNALSQEMGKILGEEMVIFPKMRDVGAVIVPLNQ